MLEIDGTPLISRMIVQLQAHVGTIHVVAGYREELVIDHCARHHPDVIIVRNPEFRTTNTAHSLSLGAAALTGKCLFLDGDLVIAPKSLSEMLQRAAASEVLVGLCRPSTENAVFAIVNGESDFTIRGFSRSEPSEFEWANIFAGPARMMDGANGFVFERLSETLPLPGHLLEIAEVDTVADLAIAERFIRDRGL